MDTYVPYPDFVECAAVLDLPDVTESLEAALAVFEVIHQIEGAHTHYTKRLPVVRMWEGREPILYQYASALNTRLDVRSSRVTQDRLDQHLDWSTSGTYTLEQPRWLGDVQLHAAHRAELVRHNPNFYGPKWPDLDAHIPLFWPFA